MKYTMLIISFNLVRAEYYIHRARLVVQNKKMRWMLLVMLGDKSHCRTQGTVHVSVCRQERVIST